MRRAEIELSSTIMRWLKAILALVVSLSIGVCALGCPGALAMQHASGCCKSMSCSHNGGHAQDCCKAMPRTNVPIVQARLVQQPQPPTADGSKLQVVKTLPRLDPAPAVAINSHSPPCLALSSSVPLRI